MFKKTSLLTLISMIVFFGCASNSIGKDTLKPVEIEIHPGEARLLKVSVPAAFSAQAKIICRDTEFKFYIEGQDYYAYIVESYFSDMGTYQCILKEGKEEKILATVKVLSKQFPEEKLKVDSRKIALRPKDQIRVAREQEVLNKIYASSENKPLFKTAFISPLNSHITSIYGIKRTYNKMHKGQHLGTDFRAPVGEKIPAANSGKIVFSGDLFFTGWTVIIDHGLDIFTVYGHLSKTLVESGQLINRGDLIGLAGSTGRSSGPHLHWGVKIHGLYIDGIDLVEQTKKQLKE